MQTKILDHNAWHARYYRAFWGMRSTDEMPKNLCNYFWGLVFALIPPLLGGVVAGFALYVFGGAVVTEARRNPDQVFSPIGFSVVLVVTLLLGALLLVKGCILLHRAYVGSWVQATLVGFKQQYCPTSEWEGRIPPDPPAVIRDRCRVQLSELLGIGGIAVNLDPPDDTAEVVEFLLDNAAAVRKLLLPVADLPREEADESETDEEPAPISNTVCED